MNQLLAETNEVYQGQFGEFTLTKADRLSVIVYRGALFISALCFAVGATAVLAGHTSPLFLQGLTVLFVGFCLFLGLSLATIHIYMVVLHRTLQYCWAFGCAAALWVSLQSSEPLAIAVYQRPMLLLGMGFVFVALTGIFFKEAFCFNRLETKFLTVIVPALLLGHLFHWLPVAVERGLLGSWAVLFIIFALRKLFQPIPQDIGDKTVFAYLKEHS